MKVIRISKRSKLKENRVEHEKLMRDLSDRTSRITTIQMLIPLGLKAVEEELQAEVLRLVGPPYSPRGGLKRWGYNPGSVFLGDQKVSVCVPRVRDVDSRQSVPLESYKAFHEVGGIDEIAFRRVLQGISTGKYEQAVLDVPQTFGIKKSSISRKFIRSSSLELKKLLSRSLEDEEIVAIFIDGKQFAGNQIVIAVGVTLSGEKIILGFFESSTENAKACKSFIQELINRGLKIEDEILFIIDGSKGLCKGIEEVMGEKALIQRCQWHKRENVVSHLAKEKQDYFRGKLQAAYHQPSYEQAKKSLEGIRRELKLVNESAMRSLEEGLEETLTLHRLGMFEKLGVSFKTTNCIETLNHQLGIYTDRVDCWKNSNQRQRWVATALLAIEPKMKKVKGFKHLKELRQAMKKFKNNHRSIAA